MPIWKVVRRLREERGAVAPLVALLLTVLLGFAGLGFEVGLWHLEKRRIQGAADAAASSAATAMIKGQNETDQARAVAATFGYQHGLNGVTVAVNRPPTRGSKAGISQAVEVIIVKDQQPLLAGLFVEGPVGIGGRAVASVEGTGGEFCVLALEVTAQATVLTGSAWLNIPTCGLGVNSANNRALRMTGSSRIDASHVSIVGGYQTTGSAIINTTQTPGPATGQAPLADPYADLQVPSFAGCNYNNFSLSGSNNKTIQPGVYCNGIKVTGSGDVTLTAGTYIVDRGAFDASGSGTIKATGPVTIVLTSSTGSNHAKLSISGSTKMDLTAPSTGPLAGMVIFQDRNASSSGDNRLTGSSIQNLTGAVYFPRQELTWTGSTQPGGTECTQVIARTVTFVGSSTLKSNCTGVGTRSLGTSTAALFE